ncbi:MAG: OmpA family protein [Helicobacteraceae bacterium]|jgi:OOP family OmpA-OmpF porin|nr:OmpA family protein [Helicobacteraceae bacterium]
MRNNAQNDDALAASAEKSAERFSPEKTIAKEARERELRWKDLPPPVSDPELIELRRRLFEREIFIIDKLKQTLDGGRFSAGEMMKIISDSIVARAGKDERFSYAMSPLVEQIVSKSMKMRQNEFVDLLFPLMGPSIRKSIAENLRTALNNFSKSLENSLSWRGIRWRIEAWRAGKSFSDVVLLHTVVYSVDQIFFVHSKTGLALAHIFRDGVENQEADMVSAMLTAINDFARDCFKGDAHDHLESLNMGARTIVIEKQNEAYLACVVRGTPSAEFRARIRDALDRLTIEYVAQLSEFNGDLTPFQHATRFLYPLLEARYVKEHKPLPTWGKAIAIAVLIGLFAALSFIYGRHLILDNHISNAIQSLTKEPGVLVIARDEIDGGKTRLRLLLDDLARKPEETIANNPAAARIEIVYTPFVSLEPEIVKKRVGSLLNAPREVTMSFEDGAVTLKGAAPLEWINYAKRVLREVPGVKSANLDGLSDPYMQQITKLIEAIEAIGIEFPVGKSDPIKEDAPKLQKAVDMLVELESAAGKVGLTPSLVVYGHADATGTAKYNYEISRARAAAIAAELYKKGSAIPVETYGMGSKYPKNEEAKYDQASRRIEMRVRLLQSTAAY